MDSPVNHPEKENWLAARQESRHRAAVQATVSKPVV
jgi:hypothetical protein